MEEFETKLAKIHIADSKKQLTYVYPLAEKAPNGASELYVIAELPLPEPAAEEPAEQICLAIASALRRSYRKISDTTTFENAVTAINEELGKLVQMGQTEWVDKLNCIVGVKDGDSFSIATTGKVAAYLFRDYEFTDISCSADTVHPLKTFDSVATGKIRLGDVLILSTTQLLNYLAMDRLRDILASSDFLIAIQTIIEILKENAGPEVAFASIFNEQVAPGEAPEEQVELEDYSIIPETKTNLFTGVVNLFKRLLVASAPKRTPSVNLPKISTHRSFFGLPDTIKNVFKRRPSKNQITSLSKNVGAGFVGVLRYGKQKLDIEHFQNFSKLKKFVFIALVILLVAAITNVVLINHYNKLKAAQQKSAKDLNAVQTLITQAQSYLLYKNDSGAQDSLAAAQQKLPARADIPASQLGQWDSLSGQIQNIKDKLEKVSRPEVTTLGNLGSGNALIKLPNYLATQSGNTIVAYNKQTGQFEDGTFLASQKIINLVYTGGTQAAVFNGSGLLMWDYEKKEFGAVWTQTVPDQNSFVGLQFYATNNRVYTVDKNAKQVVSFLVSKNTISKPVISIKTDDRLASAADMAIDGSVYILNHDGIAKFQNGKTAQFQFPALSVPFSGQGKIFTDKTATNIYVLDAGNKRIIIMDKKGSLQSVLEASEFTNLKDFQVDEPNKAIYVLNGSTLLKVNL